MTYSQLLKDGYAIRIDNGPTISGYTPTIFRYRDNAYYFDCATMIYKDIKHPTMSDRRFNKHVKDLLAEGFKIEIYKEGSPNK